MDFSSISCALESIQRRQPPLSQSILDSCQALKTIQASDGGRAPSILNVLQTFFSEDVRWEALAVGLYLSTEILRPCSTDDQEKDRTSIYPEPVVNGPTLRSQLLPNDCRGMCQLLHTACLRHLEHHEPRIRTLIIQAVSVYMKSMPEEDDLTRVDVQAQELHDLLWSRIKRDDKEPRQGGENAKPALSGGILFLETQWLCFASLIGALSNRYVKIFPAMHKPIVHTIEAVVLSSPHANPHIRVAALQTMEQWLQALFGAMDAKEVPPLSDSSQYKFRSTVVTIIASGLSDSSSQVRLAASVLCRTWFKSFQYFDTSEELSDTMSMLLPRICFNRFDSALGVKLYSQESWKLLFPANNQENDAPSAGLLAVVQYLPSVCHYYIQTCHKDQPPGIRSAAGAAICELVIRVGHHPEYRFYLEPYLLSFRHSLMENVQDVAWPVREAAGVALGTLCKTFPEVMAEEWNTLWDIWTEQLTDPMGSEAAAVGLLDLWEAFDLENDRIRELINEQLPRRNAASESSRPQIDHPCDALRLRNGHHGCPHCGRKASDGFIYLIREYVVRGAIEGTAKPLSDRELVPLLEVLAEACRSEGSVELRTVLWKCLPTMAYAFGKQRFKKLYLDIFTDLLCSNLESQSASHVSHAAAQCAEELATLVGPTIFRARLEDYHRESFDRVMRERQGMSNGPVAVDDIFPN